MQKNATVYLQAIYGESQDAVCHFLFWGLIPFAAFAQRDTTKKLSEVKVSSPFLPQNTKL